MPPAKLALSFRIFQKDQLIREDRLVQGVIKIGKVPSAHLRLDDESVSRMHAILEVTGDEVSLIDLGSTRGTYVNGKRINKARLQTGDVLQLGETRIELAISDAEIASPAPFQGVSDAARPAAPAATAPPPPRRPITAATVSAAAGELVIADATAPGLATVPTAAPPPLPAAAAPSLPAAAASALPAAATSALPAAVPPALPAHVVAASGLYAAGELAITPMPPDRKPSGSPGSASVSSVTAPATGAGSSPVRVAHATSAAAGMPLDRAPDPVAFQRAVAESAEELGGARAVEVAAMLGDSVIGVKHCMDPRSGKVTPTTWALGAAGAACLVASVIAFTASVRNASDNAHRRETWVRVDHKPERAFRPQLLGPGADWLAFGGLALGLVGVTLALMRARGERTSPYYRIGTAPGVELALENAPLPAFPLVAPSGDDFVFNYGAGIDGELIVDGNVTPLSALAATGRARPSAATAGAIEVPIPPRARIRARAGQTTFVVSAVPRPRRHTTALLARFESRALAYIAGSLVLHLAAWGFLQTIPPEEATVSVIPDSIEDLAMRAAIIAMRDPVPEPIEDRGDSSGEGSGEQAAPSMALPSGAIGNPDAPKTDGRLRVARTDDPPRMSREDAIQLAIREGFLGSDQLLSGVKALAATADFASGYDTENANGPINGVDGAGRGNFGGGITGIDIGGGCLDPGCSGTIPGAYGKIPGGRSAGADYKGPFGHGPRSRGHQSTPPQIGEPKTSGPGYDKSIIRRYIRRHINEIGYCYEKQLLAHPDLEGEVMASFLISAPGMVQSSTAKGFDAEVAGCIAGVIKTIEFPATGDGGGVQVNYPFRFHRPAQ